MESICGPPSPAPAADLMPTMDLDLPLDSSSRTLPHEHITEPTQPPTNPMTSTQTTPSPNDTPLSTTLPTTSCTTNPQPTSLLQHTDSTPVPSSTPFTSTSSSSLSQTQTLTTYSHTTSKTSPSLIKTLQPYSPPPVVGLSVRTTTPTTRSTKNPVTNTTLSSHLRSTRTVTHSPSLHRVFGPAKWDRFFVVPASAPYANNTLKFQQCLQKQVGKPTFQTRPDGSRLVRAETEAQAKALHNLLDLDSKPFPISSDTLLNTCTGTVAVPPYSCPTDSDWPSCANDLLDLLRDEYDAVSVTCYILPARGKRTRPTNIAKISFKRHELPDAVYIGGEHLRVKPYRPPPRQCQKCYRFGHPAKHCRSSPRCPVCSDPTHTRLDCQASTSICPNCRGPHNAFYKGCTTYKYEAEVAVLRYTLGLTLREARNEAKRQGLTPTPISRILTQPVPNPPVTSQPSSQPLPSSISASSLFPPSVSSSITLPNPPPPAQTSNPYTVLNPNTPTTKPHTPRALPQRLQRTRIRKIKRPHTTSCKEPTLTPPPKKQNIPDPSSPPETLSAIYDFLQQSLLSSSSSPPTSCTQLTQPTPSSPLTSVDLSAVADVHPPPLHLPLTPGPPPDLQFPLHPPLSPPSPNYSPLPQNKPPPTASSPIHETPLSSNTPSHTSSNPPLKPKSLLDLDLPPGITKDLLLTNPSSLDFIGFSQDEIPPLLPPTSTSPPSSPLRTISSSPTQQPLSPLSITLDSPHDILLPASIETLITR